jgi:hypothetical protein
MTLRRLITNPWFLGFCGFVATRTFLGSIFDLRATCADGWRSSSIGIQGACSYHGGVDRSAASAAFLASIAVGVVIGYIVHNRKVNTEQKTNLTNDYIAVGLKNNVEIEAHDAVPLCPIHREKMVLKVKDGSRVWACRHKCDRYFYERDFPVHGNSEREV